MSDQEFTLSELDSALYQFLEAYKDVDLEIVIDFQEDLGLRVITRSAGDSVARSGDPISITAALLRLMPKTAERIEEYKAEIAKAEAAARALFEDGEGE